MIWQQLKTIVWIRWRVTVNKMRKAGALGGLIASLMLAILLISMVVNFFSAIGLGIAFLSQASATTVFFIWGAIVFLMLIFWSVGLMTELQRSEILSLKQFLHLPVGGRSIFLLNFLSSFACLTMALFLPVIIGLAIAHVIVDGPIMMLLFLVIAASLLLLTSVTYQLRGWLALMMEDKRRARNIAVLAVVFFIGIAQLPQLISVYARRQSKHQDNTQQLSDLVDKVNSGEITQDEFEQQLTSEREAREESELQIVEHLKTGAAIIPPGWLPYSAYQLRNGNVFPTFFVTAGCCLLSGVSLTRAYRTTLRHCRGEFPVGKQRTKSTPDNRKVRKNWLEVELPLVSPQTSAVAMMNLRNVTRAPEARMMFLTPIILLAVMGGSVFSNAENIPSFVNPAMALLLNWIGIVSIAQLLQNTFGLDRNGFRAFVLSPLTRRQILLGKNISILPVSAFFGFVALAVTQLIFPLTVDALFGTIIQMFGLYLAACCVANYASVWGASAIAIGTAKKAKPTLVAGLLQMVAMALIPVASLPQLAACGLAVYWGYAKVLPYVPLYTVTATVALALTGLVYWRLLSNQSRVLQRGELKILSIVASKGE